MRTNKEDIKQFAKAKLIEGAEGYEIVIMLLALAKQEKLGETEILDIANYVFDNNSEEVLNSLLKAKAIANDKMLDSILTEI